ncbi:MAG: ETC complex I subunit [Anderseniella sp.]
MSARIYQPSRNAMQSGKAKTKNWVLEFDAETPREVDPLMGWTSSGDMKQQLKLSFATRDEAESYARRKGIDFQVIEPKKPSAKSKSYSDNFRYGRSDNWTH